MNLYYIYFWPRHSLVIPCFLFVVSMLLTFRNGRWVAGVIVVLPALGCFAWYAAVNWCWHALPVNHPVTVEIQQLDGSADPIILRNPDEIGQITRAFSRVRIEPMRVFLRADYRLIIHDNSGGVARYEVSRSGRISHDVPVDAIQDVYVPEVPIPPQLLTGANARHGDLDS